MARNFLSFDIVKNKNLINWTGARVLSYSINNTIFLNSKPYTDRPSDSKRNFLRETRSKTRDFIIRAAGAPDRSHQYLRKIWISHLFPANATLVFARSIVRAPLTPSTLPPVFPPFPFRDLLRFCFISRSTLSLSLFLPLLHVARIIEFPVISRRNTLYLLYRAMSTLPPGLDVDEEIRNIREAATNRALHSPMSWPNQRHAISLRSQRSLFLSLRRIARKKVASKYMEPASNRSVCWDSWFWYEWNLVLFFVKCFNWEKKGAKDVIFDDEADIFVNSVMKGDILPCCLWT